jgi:hypothetical protein
MRLTGLLVVVATGAYAAGPVASRSTASEAEGIARFASVVVPFIENVGQYDPKVAFAAPLFGGTAFVMRDGSIVYSLPAPRRERIDAQRPALANFLLDANPIKVNLRARSASGRDLVLTETLVGATPKPRGGEPSTTNVSFFLGNDPSRWHRRVRTWQSVSLGEVYPGITLELRARGRTVEKVFTLAPNVPPQNIRVRLSGAERMSLEDGGLVVTEGRKRARFSKLQAYQQRGSAILPVEVQYLILGSDSYGISIGPHDPSLAVIVDPILQATYLGGSRNDYIVGLAVHPLNGNVYVAGTTQSADFPGTTVAQPPHLTSVAFVSRFSSDLTQLVGTAYYSDTTDIYGSVANAIAINSARGNVYLATTGAIGGQVVSFNSALTEIQVSAGIGSTLSSLAIDPVTHDIVAVGSISNTAAFVARFSSDLQTTLETNSIAGANNGVFTATLGWAVAIDPVTRDVYVGGYTTSSDFPAGDGGALLCPGSSHPEGFITCLSPDLQWVIQSTCAGEGIIERLGFNPVTDDLYAVIAEPGASVLCFSSNLRSLKYQAALEITDNLPTGVNSTSYTISPALAFQPATGQVYVGGFTQYANLPGTAGGAQADFAGGYFNGYIALLSPDLTQLLQATYFGGVGGPTAIEAMAYDPTSGVVYVAGLTGSPMLPTTLGGAQSGFAGPAGTYDGFVAALTSDLKAAPALAHRVRRHLEREGP